MSGPQPIALRAGVELVGEMLERHDGRVPAAELSREAEARGISRRTMTRARAALGTASIRVGAAWYVIRPYPSREVH